MVYILPNEGVDSEKLVKWFLHHFESAVDVPHLCLL